jgi:MOSC domain-containing protein YiiM
MPMDTGKLTAIFVKRAHGGRMDPYPTGTLETARGLVGSADYGSPRQVTIVSQERWDELMREVHASLGPDARRANLVVSGIELENTRGRTLLVGTCRLVIKGETRPCEVMEEAASGLQAAMRAHWGGGAHAEVLQGGGISVGDPVTWEL